MLIAVYSGGQTGADLGALFAAESHGIKTGGWTPKGFLTENGPAPELGTRFNLKEHNSASYIPRTHANVKDSDATIRIAHDFTSPGEICTLQAIKKFKKPYLDIDINSPPDPQEVVDWIVEHNVQTLNVAGNRESKSPGVKHFTQKFLSQVFDCLMLK